VELFGNIVWLGWLMIAVLAFTIVPAVVLGRLQIPLARRLHDKALFANAEMLKADWGTAIAGIAGIVGIGLGIWWADAAAAIAISLDIAHDGWSNSRTAVREMADGEATLVDGKAVDPLRSRLETELGGLAWVDTAYVRVRSEGHVFFADCYVVPNRDSVRPQEVEDGIATLKALDWRLHEVSLTPVSDMEVEFAPRVSS
jgi:divalent metal cation (Fe/Co/Zn/Cd) transporter